MRNVQSGRIVQNSMYLMSCMLITPTLPEVRITAQWQRRGLDIEITIVNSSWTKSFQP